MPPLLLERKFHFEPKHNPFFQHARAAFFLAYRGGEPVGRITAQIDRLHLERYQDATGHFGFIEAMDDQDVFAALLTRGGRLAARSGHEARHRAGEFFPVGPARACWSTASTPRPM